jgi:hypothetical protein
MQGCKVHGCGGSIASLHPYRNATKIFLPVFDFEKIFYTLKYEEHVLHVMKILLVLMCYINHLSGYIRYFDTGY